MPSTPVAPPAYRGTFRTDLPARAAYSEGAGPYRIVPAGVAIPADLDDVVRIVAAANSDGWSLIPRGAGSGIPGHNVGEGIVVDLCRLTDPLTVADGLAVVGAAVTWQALDRLASDHGLRLPPNPSSGAFCTVGGMVATNAAGARSVRYGSIRPWVAGLEVVTGTGDVIHLVRGHHESRPRQDVQPVVARFADRVHPRITQAADTIARRFPRTRKNSAGYALDAYLASGDLLDLLVGSEGTLGIVTQVHLRLAPVPAAVGGLLIGVDRIERLGELVGGLLLLEPAALELLDTTFLALAGFQGADALPGMDAVLLVDFETESLAELEAVLDRAATLAGPRALIQQALTKDEHDRLWQIRHAASPALARLPDTTRSLQIVEDGCVPVEHLGRYLSGVRAIADAVSIDVVAFGHAGDGHVHVNALVDTTDTSLAARLRELLERVTNLVLDLGGTPSGEHGDGRLRAGAVSRMYGDEVLELFRLVKETFDPRGVLNPGVILGGPDDPVDRLKVGPQAVPIPEAVASALRGLERRAEWGQSRLELLGESNPR
ncbi:MAG: FAD-binding oxidoreductase [Gemmatimonadota bacterium]|nr:FAD-binding oxidoreductase [Gemmatimonadota bacterium]MDH3477569.1 FAD-binding oxidoreductase [Gemmatimonadota bacterium]MDH5549233.1 FAD-binding oxidoreductase [Gemmatimonadota bacterium]